MIDILQLRRSINAQRRTSLHAALERTNPLERLSLREAQSIYDMARRGNYSRIQYLYSEIERTDPVLMTCVERRASALAGLGWKVSASAASKDAALADEQKDAVTRLAERLPNLDEVIEHLALAFFRGFSHARIERGADGAATGFDLLNSYNFCYEAARRQWWWNPCCELGDPGAGTMRPVPPGELLSVVRPRAIDYPALSIYIRHALAEKSWGRFLERYGIPPVNAIMPENATEKARDMFVEAAGKAADGDNGAWPAGTQISYAGEARGVNPFSAFIDHQEKLIVLLATGGTLTSLAEAGSGTLAGNAQMDVWEQIVARDAVICGNELDRAVFAPYLRSAFPGKPVMAHFEIGKEAESSPSESFDIGAKARAAGYRIAQADLEEASGYTLEVDSPSTGDGMVNGQRSPVIGDAPLANAQKPMTSDQEPVTVLEAFAKDAGPAAEAVRGLMADPTPEAAKALMERLPDLMEDKALAAVIADAMAEEFVKAAPAPTAEAVANSKGEEKDDYVPLTQEEIMEIVNKEPGWHLATEEDEK